MAHQTIDDVSLIQSLLEVFRTHGYEGTSISQLAEATGLKKSSLYHRFPAGKEDMVKAVVVYVSEQLQKLIITPLQNHDIAPLERFQNMSDALQTFYANGKKNCLINVLNLGDPDSEVTGLLNMGYQAWLEALINMAVDAGINHDEARLRAERFLVIVEGALVIQRLTHNEQVFRKSIQYEKDVFFRS